MSAETDIAAINDGGVNTALEVRTALTSLLTPAWHRALYARSGTPHTDDDEFDDDSITGWTAVTPTGTITWVEKDGLLSALFEDQASADICCQLKAMTPSAAPVTIETTVRLLNYNGVINPMCGLVYTDGTAATSNAVAAFWWYGSGVMNVSLFSGTLTSMAQTKAFFTHPVQPRIYLRLIWAAANSWKVQWSINGVQWTDRNQGAQAATLTPTHFGVFASSWAYTEESMADFEYFRVTESDLYE